MKTENDFNLILCLAIVSVKGNWLPVGDWSKCEKIDQNSPFQDCRRMRSRSCSAPESVLGKHPVCDGSEMQTERCECPPRFG